MRLVFLGVVALLTSVPAFAQVAKPSSPDAPKSTAQDAAGLDLPVSLDHIRAGLARGPERRLRGLDRQPDFRITIEERRRLEQLLRSLDFKTGPAPPGGLYGYEQQRLLFSKTDHPLAQPYAAFSGGELVTLAIQNLILKYLGGRAVNAFTGAQRARAEKRAREEVSGAISEFCASQPDRAKIDICWMRPDL